MSKQTFKDLYNATGEAIKAMKAPIVKNRNKRAFAAAIESAEEQKMDIEEKIDTELRVVSEGKVININRVLELMAQEDAADHTISRLKKLEGEFFN